jgi:hypothetical protein
LAGHPRLDPPYKQAIVMFGTGPEELGGVGILSQGKIPIDETRGVKK